MRPLFPSFFAALLFLSFQTVPAQDPKPSPTPDPIPVRMVPLAITMVLGTLKEVEATEDSKMAMVMMAEFMPEKFAEERDKFVKIAEASRKDQIVLLEELTESLRSKLHESDRWTVDFGRRWGKTYGKAILLSQSEFKDDRTPFIESLRDLKELLAVCRKDIPPEVLPKLEKIAGTYPGETEFSVGIVAGKFVSASIELIEYLDSLESKWPIESSTAKGSTQRQGHSPWPRALWSSTGSILPRRFSSPSAPSTGPLR